jgi:hypothetical protein
VRALWRQFNLFVCRVLQHSPIYDADGAITGCRRCGLAAAEIPEFHRFNERLKGEDE